MENKMNQKTMMNNGTGAENILNMYLPEFMDVRAAHICKAEAEGVYKFNGCYISIMYMASGNIQDYLYRQLCRFDARTGRMLTPMFNECGALINFIDLATGEMLVSDQSELVAVFVHTPFCQHGFNIYKTNINAGGPQMNTITPAHTSAQARNNYGNMPGAQQGQFMNNGFVSAGTQQGYTSMQYQQQELQRCFNPTMGYNNSMTQGNIGMGGNNPMAMGMNPNGGMITMSYEDMNRQIIGLTQAINGMQNAINTILQRVDIIQNEQAKVKSCGKFDLPLESGPNLTKIEEDILRDRRLKEKNSKIKEHMDYPETVKNGKPHDPFLKEIFKIKEDDRNTVEGNTKTIDKDKKDK